MIKQIENELRQGALQFTYRDVVSYAHKMPVFTDGEDRGWAFTWIGGHSYELSDVLAGVDALLEAGYAPGDPLPCKNCKEQVEIELWKEMPGLSNHEHVDGHYYCREEDILPTTPPATCHICGVMGYSHQDICSAGGLPQHKATPNCEN